METLNADEEEPNQGGYDGAQLDGRLEFYQLPPGEGGDERRRLIVSTCVFLGEDALRLFGSKN
jgi:hypothetical protein